MTTYISGVQSDYVMSAGESLLLTATGSLVSNAGSALSATDGGHNIRIAGTVEGVNGLSLSSTSGNTSTITFSASASVFASTYGVSLTGRTTFLSNAGSIMSDDTGIFISGSASGPGTETQIVNTGLIKGYNAIVVVASTNLYSDVRLTNYGSIVSASSSNAAFVNDHPNSIDTIINEGLMAGVVYTGGSTDVVINRGSITGMVDMGAGIDHVDNSAGQDARNRFNLGSGNDTLMAGSAKEHIDGSLGFDTASYRYSNGVRVNLTDLSLNTNEAAGDFLTGIEKVDGSEFYADNLTGDLSANHLFGDGGADILSGAGGTDTLQGGAGNDRLTGGAGNDTFRFYADESGRDVITDFSNVTGNNDRFLIEAPMLGLPAGPIAAANFRAKSDNLAVDANDFFIFRTTDKTLWLDSNGSVAGGLKLLADLQDTAVVTYQDIYILPI